MWNESFEFLLGKCQRAKSHETMGVGVGVGAGQQLWKIRSLLLFLCFFPLSFPLLFFTILNIDIGYRKAVILNWLKVHYFLVNSLIFSPSFPLLYLISSPYSLSGATEGRWIIKLIKVNCLSKPAGPFGYSWKLKLKTEKYCNKIIFKCANSTVRSIFNEKVVKN